MNKKLRRVRHYDEKLDAHMLTFSCFHRLKLLSKERTCQWFVQAIERSRIKYKFHLWAWVAMPDHAHMLIWPQEVEYSTAAILHSIKSSVGKRAIQYLRKNQPGYLEKLKLVSGGQEEYHFWQDGPGHDRNLNEPVAIHEAIRYIHENPLKAKLVPQTTDWLWSSARAWAGEENPLLRIDTGSVPRVNPA